jgi:4-carboxymuconolactone decarboxylase
VTGPVGRHDRLVHEDSARLDSDDPTVRVPPAPLSALARRHRVVARVAGLATGGEPPRVLTTLARHPRLFRRWLPFGRTLLLRPALPRPDVELVLLRTAWSCGSWYEWAQHVQLAVRAGLPAEVVQRVPHGPGGPGWTPRQSLLLRATDELHADRVVTDDTWGPLSDVLDERQLIELCLLVGHYEMLAMALNTLGVRPEPAVLGRLTAAQAGSVQQLRAGLVAARRRPAGPGSGPDG